MLENIDASPNPRDDGAGTPENYLTRAVAACEAGDARLGLHLYLAAFEQASEQSDVPSEDAIMGLKQAWRVACSTKERALAEYIFERLEPYLSTDEVQVCLEQLQALAMEHLEGIGFSGEDLIEVTEAADDDFMDVMGPLFAAIGRGETPSLGQAAAALAGPVAASGAPAAPEEGAPEPVDIFSYANLSGYGSAVERMRSLGVGLSGTPEFDDFVAMLNARHGLDTMPVVDSILFCSPAREDASRFMMATVGELGLPAIRMRMEETFQGVPMLCVSAQATDAEKLAGLRQGFAGPGVLVLEDLDLWGSPVAEAADDMAGFLMAAMSRGAREAVNLIRQAVENPEVYVLASASSAEAIDPYFMDLLYPVTCIDIDYPNEEERADIWMDIARQHPSMRSVSRDELVRLSAHLPRYDIYMAAREAIEEAYKQGLVARRYIPVSRENLFDKLAAYHPLDSAEYAELEKLVVSDFSASLGDLDDLMG
ncbi:ATP-binding protein [Adlercreutzia shanghongiae]|uniref:Ribonucleotide reductase subunit alpha n=1 Tax=Adlercreutzia shanghongiae TaxID=3111773 RepID=A0ABU6IZI3_9ACTN|nr:ribonucleotide reductase subunit alpha [Adlercreutzia sp. R22]MEC4295262.1 ribonucleotide reductase subunit alpha [Adlercreutzia sp. R22]